MTLATISAAIRGRFGTEVEDVQSLPTIYDNQEDGDDAIPADGLWCRLSVLFGETNNVSTAGVGSRLYRTAGVVIAQLFKPAGEGEGDLIAIADAIVTAFRGVGIASPDITFYAPSVSQGSRDEAWWQRNVTIPFRADEYA